MSDARRILLISGNDAKGFLQGLVTNNVDRLSDGLVYTALLTPQGKYLADFFMVPDASGILIDVAEPLADMLKSRLSMYKLRADVTIEEKEIYVHRGLAEAPADAYADPRHESLGWRAYRPAPQEPSSVDWDAVRVAALVPETGIELTPESYILEMGFERLNGVDFRKGCYVGQEVTARMKHKTTLQKGLAQVTIQGAAESGSEITSNGKSVGQLLTRSGNSGIAYLRFNRAKGEMAAGDAMVTYSPDD